MVIVAILVAILIVVGLTIAWILRSMQKLRNKCIQLESARVAAVAAAVDRDDRIAIVSHDLRTPLRAILLSTPKL
jgi:signal transduction histidine kinase